LPQPEKSFAELFWEVVSLRACNKGHKESRGLGNPHAKERERNTWLFPFIWSYNEAKLCSGYAKAFRGVHAALGVCNELEFMRPGYKLF
jgi:hypothetical protein